MEEWERGEIFSGHKIFCRERGIVPQREREREKRKSTREIEVPREREKWRRKKFPPPPSCMRTRVRGEEQVSRQKNFHHERGKERGEHWRDSKERGKRKE